MVPQRSPDIAVIGGGVRRVDGVQPSEDGCARYPRGTWGPGNSRSTSGDETRGVRTSGYGDRLHGELWARWANEAIKRWKAGRGTRANVSDACLPHHGGPDLPEGLGTVPEGHRANWDKTGIRYEVLKPNDVRSEYPVIDLKEIGVVQYEPNAGVVRARRACETVAEAFARNGGQVVIARALPSLANGKTLQDISLSTARRSRPANLSSRAGRGCGKIFPEFLRTRLRTPMGNVFYYRTPVGDNRFVAPYLPSFNFPGVTGWPALPNDARGFRVRVGGGQQTDPARACAGSTPAT